MVLVVRAELGELERELKLVVVTDEMSLAVSFHVDRSANIEADFS